jgi:thiamine biosynthesis lipoprotein
VNAGGDMLGHGDASVGGGVLVALRDPRGGRGDLLPDGKLVLRGAAVCTSGSYERFTTIEGRRYSHILDPRTGWPVEDVVLQASVVAPTCELADALATALMVLGVEEGLRLVERLDGVEALLVRRDGDGVAISESAGFAALRPEGDR